MRRTLMLIGLSLVLLGSPACRALAAQAQPSPQAMRVLVMGDSLSAEYGLARGSGWVQIIEQKLAQRKPGYELRNASISGETTAGGLRRLPALLEEFRPDLVILQLGANDGLRGQPVQAMKKNLLQMVNLALESGSQVLLVGQHIPPNYGQRYSQSFHAAFSEVAKETGITLVPFMLEGIATDTSMFQADGLHPTAKAQQHIADTIWRHLAPLLG